MSETLSSIPGPTAAERFWAKVDRRSDTECWIWTAAANGAGYGWFRLNGTTSTAAHRVAHMLLVGPIPSDLTIDHLCCVTLCVNPAHFELVTRGENAARGDRRRRGERRKSKCGHPLVGGNVLPRPGRVEGCRICRMRTDQRAHIKAGLVNCRCGERAAQLEAELTRMGGGSSV